MSKYYKAAILNYWKIRSFQSGCSKFFNPAFKYTNQRVIRRESKSASYSKGVGPTLFGLRCIFCHDFWTNCDLDLFSTSKWPSDLQFCERYKGRCQKKWLEIIVKWSKKRRTLCFCQNIAFNFWLFSYYSQTLNCNSTNYQKFVKSMCVICLLDLINCLKLPLSLSLICILDLWILNHSFEFCCLFTNMFLPVSWFWTCRIRFSENFYHSSWKI